MYAQSISGVQICETPWTAARQAPLSMGFSRQEYWSGLPFPPLRDLPNTGIEDTPPVSPALASDSLLLHHLGSLHSKCIQSVYKASLDEASDGRDVFIIYFFSII